MKYTCVLLVIAVLFFNACQNQEEPAPETKNPTSAVFPDFKSAFTPLELSDTLNIHHWDWANKNDTTYFGRKVDNDWLKKYVDTTTFRINPNEDYYAVNYIEAINAYLIRIANPNYEYQQQIFALMYNEQGELTDRKKMAGFYGAIGFKNTQASWLVLKDGTVEMIMRNENWSTDVENGEIETDSIRVYQFENNTFVSQNTFATSKKLKQQFKFIID